MSLDEFVYRRVHRASPELLFECMTTPEHLVHFWGPAGSTTRLDGFVVDLRVGGAFEARIIDPRTGEGHVMRAVYDEIEAPHRLVWREVDSGMVTAITFADLGDGTTEVTTHQRRVPPAYRSPAARSGWSSALDRFADHVERIASRR